MTKPRCHDCDFEIRDTDPVEVLYFQHGAELRCQACVVVAIMDAQWQKEHAERSE